MRMAVDAKSCVLGVSVGAGVLLLVGSIGGNNPAVGQPAPGAASDGPGRYQLGTWAATTGNGGTNHGAYVLDRWTGDVREIKENGNVSKYPNDKK